ncbi:MAG: hypothetical protein L0H96_03180 [Humibacillus sp.]|nr:hypothetical protein [Humibacillus sp.]MDN5775895.1 hypothetical protein [Humibacillus sp.]
MSTYRLLFIAEEIRRGPARPGRTLAVGHENIIVLGSNGSVRQPAGAYPSSDPQT